MPRLATGAAGAIGTAALELQGHWRNLRDELRTADELLSVAVPGARLFQFDGFWGMGRAKFQERVAELHRGVTPERMVSALRAQAAAKAAVDRHWHLIVDAEEKLEAKVRAAYRVADRVYELLMERAPEPSVTWALRP